MTLFSSSYLRLALISLPLLFLLISIGVILNRSILCLTAGDNLATESETSRESGNGTRLTQKRGDTKELLLSRGLSEVVLIAEGRTGMLRINRSARGGNR